MQLCYFNWEGFMAGRVGTPEDLGMGVGFPTPEVAPTPPPPSSQGVEAVARPILAQVPPDTAQRPRLTATGAQDVVSDWSYFVRTLMADGVAAQAMGVTTAINLFQGVYSLIQALGRFASSYGIGDRDGMADGGLAAVGGGCQAIGGGAFLAYRVAMMALYIQRAGGGAILGPAVLAAATTAAPVLAIVGATVFTAVYAIILIRGVFALVRNKQFAEQLKGCGDNHEALCAFLEARMANPVEQAKFARATSGACVQAVEAAFNDGLTTRLRCSTDLFTAAAARGEVMALRKRITSANDKNQTLYSAIAIIGFVGLAVSIAGFVALPAAAAAVLLVVTLALGAMMVAVDGKCLIDSLQGEGPRGKYDRAYLLSCGAILFTAFVVSCVVTACFGLAPLALIPAGVICLAGLLIIKYSLNKLDERDARWTQSQLAAAARRQATPAVTSASARPAVAPSSATPAAASATPVTPAVAPATPATPAVAPSSATPASATPAVAASVVRNPVVVTPSSATPVAVALSDEAIINGLLSGLTPADHRLLRAHYVEQSGLAEGGLKTPIYRALDTYHDFGGAYLLYAKDPAEYRNVLQAIEQTLQHDVAAQDTQSRQALQRLQEVIRVEQGAAAVHQYIRTLMTENFGAYTLLKTNVWYVCRVQESRSDLQAAVQRVLGTRASNQAVAATA